jgi:hypothetical protein
MAIIAGGTSDILFYFKYRTRNCHALRWPSQQVEMEIAVDTVDMVDVEGMASTAAPRHWHTHPSTFSLASVDLIGDRDADESAIEEDLHMPVFIKCY